MTPSPIMPPAPPNPAMEARRTAYESLLAAGVYTHPLPTLAVQRAVDTCTACPLSATTSSRVPWNGVSGRMALVGEAPGAQEEAQGLPFVGPSGKLLSSILEEAGFDEPVPILNTIGCRPPRNDYGVAINNGAVEACRVHLDRQLDAAGAWVIVEVGGHAMRSFGNKSSVSSQVGAFRWVQSRLHTTIFHPSYLLRIGRKPEAVQRCVNVLRHVRAVIDGISRKDPPLLASAVPLLDPNQNAASFSEQWRKQGWVPVYSRAIERNVIVYDPLRVHPGHSSIKLPGGFGDPTYLTPDEIVRIRDAWWLRFVAELKDHIGFEVVG